MISRNIHLIRLIILLILVLGITFFLINKIDAFEIMSKTNFQILTAVIFTHAISFLIIGFIYYLPLKKIDMQLSFKQWFGLSNLASLFNLIFPAKSGTALRWFYLKEFHQLPTKKFFSMNMLATGIGLISLSFLGLIITFLFPEKDSNLFSNIDSIFWTLFVLGSLIVVILIRNNPSKLKIMSSLPVELKNSKVFLSIFFCFFLVSILYPIRSYLTFYAIGIELSLFETLELSLLISVVSIFPILPGNIGIKEMAMVYIGKRYGISAELAIFASLIERVGLYVFLIPFGFSSYFFIFGNQDNNFTKSEMIKFQ